MSKYLINGSELTLGKIVSMSLVTLIIAGGISLEMFLFNFDDAHAATSGAIVFASDRDGDYDLYIMNADGTNIDMLTKNSAQDIQPSLSSDGTKIVFASDRDGDYEIYLMHLNDSTLKKLTNNNAKDTFPTFSPNGKYIAFTSNRDGNSEIYTMNTDGSHQRNLTNNRGYDAAPSISSDAQIAFYSNRDGNFEIYITNGRNTERLTNNNAADRHPSFNSDGTRIAFASDRDGDQEIYTMSIDGSNVKKLTNNKVKDTLPIFGPKNDIAFVKDIAGNEEIYIHFRDGTTTNISNNPSSDKFPSWSITPDVDADTNSFSNVLPDAVKDDIQQLESKVSFVGVQFNKAETEFSNIDAIVSEAKSESSKLASDIRALLHDARETVPYDPQKAQSVLNDAENIYENNFGKPDDIKTKTEIRIDSEKELIRGYIDNAKLSCNEIQDAVSLIEDYGGSLEFYGLSGLAAEIEENCSDDKFTTINERLQQIDVLIHRDIRTIQGIDYRLENDVPSDITSIQKMIDNAVPDENGQEYAVPVGIDVIITSGSSVEGCGLTNQCHDPYEYHADVGEEVTWHNNDDASHTIVSGTPENGPDGIFNSGLFGPSEEFSFTFTEEGRYPYFDISHPWATGVVVVGTGSPEGEVGGLMDFEHMGTVYTGNQPYQIEWNISKGVVTDIQLDVESKTLILDESSSSSGTLQIKLPRDLIEGTQSGSERFFVLEDGVEKNFSIPRTTSQYQVLSIPFAAGNSMIEIIGSDVLNDQAKGVSPELSPIPETGEKDEQIQDGSVAEIPSVSTITVVSTDQQGNPVDSFRKGGLGYAKVTVAGDANSAPLTTVNLFDSESTSLGVGSFKGAVSGNSEMIISFYIPEDAATGRAEIFANVFSDWPTNGGTPLTGEVSGEVIIE